MLIVAIPKLPAINMEETKKFYLEKLGFTLINQYPDYLLLKKDQIELHFFSFTELDPKKSDFMIYIRIDQGIEEMYDQLIKEKVARNDHGQIERKPWRQIEFSILDPNGTLLTFGQPF